MWVWRTRTHRALCPAHDVLHGTSGVKTGRDSVLASQEARTGKGRIQPVHINTHGFTSNAGDCPDIVR